MKEDNIIRATVFVHKVDDRYPGETEDILKKIAEAGEEPESIKSQATAKEKEEAVKEAKKCVDNILIETLGEVFSNSQEPTFEEFDKVMNKITFRQQCEHFLKEVMPLSGDKGTEKLIEMGFTTAPASTHYHGSHPGGLFEHSMEVTRALCQLSMDCELKWERHESPLIIGMFHDLCKIDQYIQKEDGTYEWNKEAPEGHGTKSIEYIEKYAGITLTEEEKACIEHHMGAFSEKEEWSKYTDAIKKFPNVLFTHTADMIATHIKGR